MHKLKFYENVNPVKMLCIVNDRYNKFKQICCLIEAVFVSKKRLIEGLGLEGIYWRGINVLDFIVYGSNHFERYF